MIRSLLLAFICGLLAVATLAAGGQKSPPQKDRKFKGELVIPKALNLAMTPKGVTMFLATGEKSYGLTFTDKKLEDEIRKAAGRLKVIVVTGKVELRSLQVPTGKKAEVIVGTSWKPADKR